ncbi:MAG: hypothetical protein WAV08_04160 [Desulfobacterales bacterium]
MKPEELYQHLKDLAEKLGISVREQNLRHSGLRVRSGFCKVKGRPMYIMSKHLNVQRKNEKLAGCLNRFPHEGLYLMPAVREFLQHHGRERAAPVQKQMG